MKVFASILTVFVFLSVADDVCAQSKWNWKGWNGFAKDRSEAAEVEPIEITDDEESSAWKNPLAGWGFKPKPVEWRTPAFIKRMNENNARAWRRTRRNIGHWASSTSSAIRTSTYNTWEALSGGDDADESPQPPSSYGGVHDFLNRPKLKF